MSIERLKELLRAALPDTMGGYPDLFSPQGGWDQWEDDVKAAIKKAQGEPGTGSG